MRTFKKLIQERDLEIAQQPDDLNFEEHDKFAKFDDLIKMLMKDVDLMTGSNKENMRHKLKQKIGPFWDSFSFFIQLTKYTHLPTTGFQASLWFQK